MELRSAVRFPLHLPLAVRTDSYEMAGETCNISAGGMLFSSESDMSPGTTLEFRIAMPADVLGAAGDVVLNGVARVVRCDQEGTRRTVAAVIDEYRFERA